VGRVIRKGRLRRNRGERRDSEESKRSKSGTRMMLAVKSWLSLEELCFQWKESRGERELKGERTTWKRWRRSTKDWRDVMSRGKRKRDRKGKETRSEMVVKRMK
jgi:hypothetical protein